MDVHDIEQLVFEVLRNPNATVADIMVAAARKGALGVIEGDQAVTSAAAELLRAGSRVVEASGGDSATADEKLGMWVGQLAKKREADGS